MVIAAIHTGFKQPKEQLAKRFIRACTNKYVHIIAHPTGRRWGTRDAYEIDFERILKVAKETNTSLEINAFPPFDDKRFVFRPILHLCKGVPEVFLVPILKVFAHIFVCIQTSVKT